MGYDKNMMIQERPISFEISLPPSDIIVSNLVPEVTTEKKEEKPKEKSN